MNDFEQIPTKWKMFAHNGLNGVKNSSLFPFSETWGENRSEWNRKCSCFCFLSNSTNLLEGRNVDGGWTTIRNNKSVRRRKCCLFYEIVKTIINFDCSPKFSFNLTSTQSADRITQCTGKQSRRCWMCSSSVNVQQVPFSQKSCQGRHCRDR